MACLLHICFLNESTDRYCLICIDYYQKLVTDVCVTNENDDTVQILFKHNKTNLKFNCLTFV